MRLAKDRNPRWWMGALLLGLAMAGCTARGTNSATATEPALLTSQPAQETVQAGPLDWLVSHRTDSPPAIDGRIEEAWMAAEPLLVRMTWGQSTERAWDVELRSLHTAQSIYWVARWPGAPPSEQESAVLNKLSLHWSIPGPAAQGLSCMVVCHTASADEEGRFIYANTETIPQGGSEVLPAAGGWQDGTWTLEWSRPLSSSNPFDIQFDDPAQVYPFRLKIFEHVLDRPDPVSQQHALVFP